MKRTISVTVIVWLLAIPAFADIITFEGLGFNEQDPVMTIGLATFIAEIAIQGGPQFAFGGNWGNDTGSALPFSNPGNVLITRPGGYLNVDPVEEVTVDFAEPVESLSFLVCDIDSRQPSPTAIEQLRAEIFDADDASLGVITATAPTSGDHGDGSVIMVDFGEVGAIRRLVIQVINIGEDQTAHRLGFGIDNLRFEPQIVPLDKATWGTVKTLCNEREGT